MMSFESLTLEAEDSRRHGTFQELDITSWRGRECYEWATNVCQEAGVDTRFINLSPFGNITGAVLMNYTEYDFHDIDCTYGRFLYNKFQQLLHIQNRDNFVSHTPDSFVEDDANLFPDTGSLLFDLGEMDLDDIFEAFDVGDSVVPEVNGEMGQIGSDLSSLGAANLPSFPDLHSAFETSLSSSGAVRLPSSSPDLLPSFETSLSSSRAVSLPYSSPELLPHSDALGKVPTQSRKKNRGPKNWEFLLRLLMDRRYNPELIKWEDYGDKTFRLMQPAVIAQMWGKRSKKPNLSYDNFARGLRYQYTTGALMSVREKQLVYKCGKPALQFLQKLQQ